MEANRYTFVHRWPSSFTLFTVFLLFLLFVSFYPHSRREHQRTRERTMECGDRRDKAAGARQTRGYLVDRGDAGTQRGMHVAPPTVSRVPVSTARGQPERRRRARASSFSRRIGFGTQRSGSRITSVAPNQPPPFFSFSAGVGYSLPSSLFPFPSRTLSFVPSLPTRGDTFRSPSLRLPISSRFPENNPFGGLSGAEIRKFSPPIPTGGM